MLFIAIAYSRLIFNKTQAISKDAVVPLSYLEKGDPIKGRNHIKALLNSGFANP